MSYFLLDIPLVVAVVVVVVVVVVMVVELHKLHLFLQFSCVNASVSHSP